MAYPKMTLKVELIGESATCVKLVQVTDIFTKCSSYKKTGKAIVTQNNWLFFVGDDFSINMKAKNIFLPINPNKHKDTIFFAKEQNRKELLREFHTALLYWSDNKLFKGRLEFSKEPRIRYHKNIWIIF